MKALFRLPSAADISDNPSAEELQKLAAKMPNARWTKLRKPEHPDRASSRAPRPRRSSYPTKTTRASPAGDLARGSGRADRPSSRTSTSPSRDMIVIDGYIGDDPDLRTPVAPLHRGGEREHRRRCSSSSTSPSTTRDASSPSWPSSTRRTSRRRGHSRTTALIIVDLEQGVTRVCNSDYFGESKKGGLRMWNKLVYDRGGLPLHAGCKVIPTERGDTRRPDRRPVRHGQDHHDVHQPERLAAGAGRLRRDAAGRARSTRPSRLLREDVRSIPDDEPTIYGAVTQPEAYLENVSQTRRRGRLLRHLVHAERPRDVLVRA